MSEMMKAWEHSVKKAKESESWEDKSRFYDMRKRPTNRPRHSGGGITPEGEAVYAMREGWDNEVAEPMERELKEDI